MAAFFVAAWQLNPLALKLAPLALAILFFYSYTKRFTNWSHLFLGFALGISPAAAWIAITGGLDVRMLILCAAVTLWVGGFDVLYACQDMEYDRSAGLFSVPKRFGIANALLIARAMHVGVIALLAWLALSFGLPWPAWAGIAVVAALLAYEHSLVKADDLSKLDAAFFTVNGYISMLFLLFWGAAACGLAAFEIFDRIRNERTDNHRSAVEADRGQSSGRRAADHRGRHRAVSLAGLAGGRLAGESRAREKARQRDVFQRQPAHQSHEHLRRALQALRLWPRPECAGRVHILRWKKSISAPNRACAKARRNFTWSAACIPICRSNIFWK